MHSNFTVYMMVLAVVVQAASLSAQQDETYALISYIRNLIKISRPQLMEVELLKSDELWASNNVSNDTNLETSYTPVVLWHGLGDNGLQTMSDVRSALQQQSLDIPLISIQFGQTVEDDIMAGILGNVNRQIDQVCDALLNDKQIQKYGRFNAIGFSQGAQFLRGVIERCPFGNRQIKVKNFISLGGQHQGVFAIPKTDFLKNLADIPKEEVSELAYEDDFQEGFVPAQYWHDPYREEQYRSLGAFLPNINNDDGINETYRDNLLLLETMVLVEFSNDTTVTPRESSLFGFYATNDSSVIVPLEESNLYLEDRIGLKSLKESDRLHLIRTPGRHLQYSQSWFLNEIVDKYLVSGVST